MQVNRKRVERLMREAGLQGIYRHNLRVRGIAERNVRKWGGSNKGYWRVAGSQVLSGPCPTPTGNTSA
jgi:hypothetical protein